MIKNPCYSCLNNKNKKCQKDCPVWKAFVEDADAMRDHELLEQTTQEHKRRR